MRGGGFMRGGRPGPYDRAGGFGGDFGSFDGPMRGFGQGRDYKTHYVTLHFLMLQDMVVVLEDLDAECPEEEWEVLDLEGVGLVEAEVVVDLEAEKPSVVVEVEEGLVGAEVEDVEDEVGLRWEDLVEAEEATGRLMSSRCGDCLSGLQRMILQR